MAKNDESNILQILEEENFQQSLVAVTSDDYTRALEKLMSVATQDTGQSGVAAQVLLSLYNSHEWHMGLVDLCALDTDLFAAALIAIRGRFVLMQEPQNVIENGDRRFARIWDNWHQYHLSERYKSHYSEHF